MRGKGLEDVSLVCCAKLENNEVGMAVVYISALQVFHPVWIN
jgi:hypothetical protein